MVVVVLVVVVVGPAVEVAVVVLEVVVVLVDVVEVVVGGDVMAFVIGRNASVLASNSATIFPKSLNSFCNTRSNVFLYKPYET